MLFLSVADTVLQPGLSIKSQDLISQSQTLCMDLAAPVRSAVDNTCPDQAKLLLTEITAPQNQDFGFNNLYGKEEQP